MGDLPLVKSLRLGFLLGKCGRKYSPCFSYMAVVRIQWANRLFIYVFLNRYLSKAYSVPTLLQTSGVLSEPERRETIMSNHLHSIIHPWFSIVFKLKIKSFVIILPGNPICKIRRKEIRSGIKVLPVSLSPSLPSGLWKYCLECF